MATVNLKWIFTVGLALAVSLPAFAEDFVVEEATGKYLVPAGALMCRNQEALKRYIAANERERQWLTGACYVNAKTTRFNHITSLRNGVLVGKGLRGNPRIDRYIDSDSYNGSLIPAIASN